MEKVKQRSDDCSSNPCECDCHGLELDREEVQALVKFLYSVGYISYEFHADVHKISKKLEDFLA